MLSLTRNISESYHQLKLGSWQKAYSNDGYRKSLSETKIGIVGLGHVGQLVAKKLIFLGAEVYGYHPNITDGKKQEIGLPIRYTTLSSIMKKCDIVSLHLRLDKETSCLLNADLLSLMRRNAYLVNTARAGLIEEEALIKIIQEKRIGGVALDVTWQEPINSEHPLLKYENVIITPHIAGDTDVIERAPSMLMKELFRYLANEPTQMLIKEKYMTNHWSESKH